MSATGAGPVRVLLVDDDPDQYLLTEELLSDTHDGSWLVTLDWARSFEDGLQRLSAGQHDVALIDYRLGARTGVELLQERDVRRAGIPAIMLTADSRGGTDLEAMAAGAVDYLVKDEVTAPLLKRALRYAVERQRVVTSLLDSEAEYQSAFEEAPVGIAHTSLDGRGLRVNAALRALLGCSTDQFREIDYAGLVHPSDAEASARHRAGLLAGTANRYTAEKRFRRRAGSYFWANVTVSLHRDARGAPKYFITVVEDISQRRQAQQELDHIFNLSPDMLCTANYSGYFIRTNAAWSQALGYSADELKHTPFLDFVHPDDREATQREFERLTAGRTTFNFNNRYRTADGTYRWIEWHSKVDPENQIVYAVARDQTDRHLLEEQLRQAQKMEAVGRLAGGVAHDFNNLLTAILSFAEMTLEQLQPDDPLYLDVQQIQHAGQSAASLTKQLLAFSRMQILEPQIICGNILVGDMEGLLRRVLGEDVELVVSLAAGADCINADRTQIEQVLMNLAINARDAMPKGGTLSISTDVIEPDATFLAAHPGALQSPHVRLRVADTGDGMTPDVLAHLFEPFFTTKERGKGTGLGLATVYGVVEQSGGHIDVQSAPGHGTTFTLAFPVVPPGPAPIPLEEHAEHVPGGGETILVVEDQEEVRRAATQTLQRRGYRVLAAPDGKTALALLDSEHSVVHLLITDVVMPQMSGPDLADMVRRDYGITRVLFMSGYTDDAVSRHGVLDAGIDLLQKPFSPGQMLRRVRQSLDRTASSPVV